MAKLRLWELFNTVIASPMSLMTKIWDLLLIGSIFKNFIIQLKKLKFKWLMKLKFKRHPIIKDVVYYGMDWMCINLLSFML